ncbi:hypothetical protein CA13_51290 [Planctomycetes bacterium CA13]|uniref:Uncharacterized protein n=1 Tax=Novipirellula herctigrandis TaxID=2527986 RepID=A0A5C5Z8M8_9BACT|nr:hypothetical protein CA13_51290 [Planctomycetes bacterium CA13]
MVAGLNSRIHETGEMNAEATVGVENENDRAFMCLAKLDHIIWKVNTYLCVIDNKPAFDFVDHHKLPTWKMVRLG